MTFRWFRKYEKLFLWGTVVFAVLLLATFSGFGDFQTLLERSGSGVLMGEFVVQSTGKTERVGVDEYQRVHTALNRLAYQRRAEVTEDDVWAHIMLVADARGARLDVADSELAQALSGGQPLTAEEYRSRWRFLQFSSAREFESFVREMLLGNRWQELKFDEARIVTADEVYLRWRTDNELFDIEALVFPDQPLEDIDDPDEDTLRAWWDGQAEPVRAVRYVEPSRQDIVYAWLPIAGGAERLPNDKLSAVAEPDPGEVEARWHQVQASRFPDTPELDEPTRALLAGEVKLVRYVEQVLSAFQALPEQTAESFTAAMTEAGLSVENPEGQLGPDELKALPDIGDENLPLFLGHKEAGSTYFGYPYGTQPSVYGVFVETVKPSRPLEFEEAHDQLVKAWKEEQRDRAARDFREEITRRTRELPEAAAAIAPLLATAQQRAEEQIAAQPELDEAGKEALRTKTLEEAEQQEVVPRLAEFEHQVWTQLEMPEGARRIVLPGVRKSYARKPDGTEEAGSVERFLKTNGAIFGLAVNTISQPLRHGPGNQTAIVRVTGRSFPDKAEMLADRESMNASREQLAQQRQFEAMQSFAPEALKASHELRVSALPPGR